MRKHGCLALTGLMDVNLHDFCFSISLADGRQATVDHFTEEALSAICAIENSASETPWSAQNFRDSLQCSHICLGAQVAHRWVAYAIFSLAAQEAELLLLAVAPDYQRQKIASRMLSALECPLSRYADEIFLEVRESNLRAIQLYESLGYHCLGERKNYYRDPSEPHRREHAKIYGKHIAQL